MTTQQWHFELRSALDSATDNKINAARRLEQLAARSRRHAKSTIGDWHFEQALGLAATLLADAGRHKDAVRFYRRLARHHAESLAYQGRALASTQTALALTLFAARDPAAAAVGREAMRWGGQFGDPSAALEKLLGQLREFLNAKARRRRRSEPARPRRR